MCLTSSVTRRSTAVIPVTKGDAPSTRHERVHRSTSAAARAFRVAEGDREGMPVAVRDLWQGMKVPTPPGLEESVVLFSSTGAPAGQAHEPARASSERRPETQGGRQE